MSRIAAKTRFASVTALRQSLGDGFLHDWHLRTAAKLAGAVLECDSAGKWCTWQLCAPAGQQWDSGCHCLKVEWLRGDSRYRDQAIRDAIERLEQTSLVPCEPDCDCFDTASTQGGSR